MCNLMARQDDSRQKMAAASKALQEQAGELEAGQTSDMFRARDVASFWMIVFSLAGVCLGATLAVATTRQLVRAVRATINMLQHCPR